MFEVIQFWVFILFISQSPIIAEKMCIYYIWKSMSDNQYSILNNMP